MIERVIPVLMCRDVGRTVAFFARLGFTCNFVDDTQAPKYAAFHRDGVQLHAQWQDESQFVPGLDRPTYRFIVDDVAGLHQEFQRAGITDMRAPWNTDWGTFEFHVRDVDGNGLHFYHVRS